MPEHIIEAENITVRFGDFTAVDNLSVEVNKGEIYGFLGPNGAGKTTTAKVLTTMMKPTSGKIRIGGHPTDTETREARELVGVVQQHFALDKDISVRENIVCRAVLHRVPKKQLEERMKELCDVIGLTPYMDKKVQDLSGGWKRKLAIVCALMHSPEILFLDEPTAGLDTQSRHMLWDIVRVMNRRGTTVFITTHYMDEAEALCDRVSIITHGVLKATGTPKELCDTVGRFTVEYDSDEGRRQYRYFATREEAMVFYNTVEERNANLRGTHLEDVFLEETGRADTKALEKALRI